MHEASAVQPLDSTHGGGAVCGACHLLTVFTAVLSAKSGSHLTLRLLHEHQGCRNQGPLPHIVHRVCEQRLQQGDGILHACRHM